jgi:hypothetical protein
VVDLKTIDYRGGVVRFAIPASWLEEYEPQGGGTFYRDHPDSGTLRLNVLTFEGKGLPDKEALLRAAGQSGTPEWLPTGNAFVSYRTSASENGETLAVFHWHLANAVAPRHLRLALFSYTVLADQADSAAVKQEVQLLTEQVRNATFSADLGSVPS